MNEDQGGGHRLPESGLNKWIADNTDKDVIITMNVRSCDPDSTANSTPAGVYMNKLLKILVVHSLSDLFKHKSFFLLMFILILADRGLKILKKANHLNTDLITQIKQLDMAAAGYIFDRLPDTILGILADYRFFLVLIVLFLFKQLISLWPSSDMRRMHRQERGKFGIWASLAAIRWEQILWDAIAVSTLCLIVGIWCLGWFWAFRILWGQYPSVIWMWGLALSVCAVFPIIMAGFSYSSKLAVISRGKFSEKLVLYYKLFLNRRIALWSWIFYAVRLFVEAVFVAALPAYILLTIDLYFLQILLAAVLATPVYSYLKMASFKFFLVVYMPYKLVQQEYDLYYRQLAAK